MKSLIRGGQTSLHSFHMSAQLFWVMLKMALLVAMLGDLIYVFCKFDLWDLKEILIYYLARFLVFLGGFGEIGSFSFENFVFTFTGRFGDIHHLSASSIVANLKVVALKNSFFAAIWHGLLFGLLAAFSFFLSLLYLFNLRGKKLSAKKFIRGGLLVSKSQLKKMILRANFKENLKDNFGIKLGSKIISKIRAGIAGESLRTCIQKPYHLANIPFPKDAEFLHTIILGSTGTGKTNAILELIDQIKKNGDAAIIYDKMGTYTATYFDENSDIILNPLDERCQAWSLFNEVRKESDYDYLASAFIPEKKSGSDPFWIEAARRVFAVFAKEIHQENPNITNSEFVEALLRSNHKQIAQFLAGTEAASLISTDSEKTSLSILAILSAYISSIKYLRDEKNNSDDKSYADNADNQMNQAGSENQKTQQNKTRNKARNKAKFSIRKWIESAGIEPFQNISSSSSFLFISSKGDQHESLKPLISTWLDIAVKSLLSLEQQQNRRIWIILDEVGSLQSLPSLLDGLAQSRQFGGAFVISLHSISQLKAIYGKDTTDTITSLCRNKLFFSVPDNETAEFCSQNLGFEEIEEVKEGISYGVSEIRDGVNLNTHKHLARLVIPSELMFMKKLQAYLKFAGEFPIAKVSFSIKKRPQITQRFVECKDQQESKIEDIENDGLTQTNSTILKNLAIQTKQAELPKSTEEISEEEIEAADEESLEDQEEVDEEVKMNKFEEVKEGKNQITENINDQKSDESSKPISFY